MSLLRNQIKKALLDRGMILSRPPGQFLLTEYKLARLQSRGLRVDTIVDVGAADGTWTRAMKQVSPGARVLMIEPRDEVQPALQKVVAELDDVELAQSLVGAAERDVSFNELGDQTSVLNAHDGSSFGHKRHAHMTTIDGLLQQYGFHGVSLLKLDLQGYELEALKGAEKTLQTTDMVLIEVNFLPIFEGAPLAGNVVQFMTQHNFHLCDIMGLWHRPIDGALAQGDFAFVRKDHPLICDGRWDEHGFSVSNGATP